jgi:hypothetical protein
MALLITVMFRYLGDNIGQLLQLMYKLMMTRSKNPILKLQFLKLLLQPFTFLIQILWVWLMSSRRREPFLTTTV